jgi:hypothetical protein
MDIQKEDINRELSRIKDKLDSNTTLTEEDLKIILLSALNEEDLHESKQ